jgi:wyosine [tRNA(Phe)-imidazoG37] synthetase (radical SAM superfamily)
LKTDSLIFGPVPSRRLGISLGIDIIPFKTCSLDCIYCECGATNHLSLERRYFVDVDTVLSQLKQILKDLNHVDYITFSGSGEPTLNKDIGTMISEIKRLTSIPVAVLTNGTLLYRDDVARDLLPADVILPSLDAVSEEVFSKINRPHPQLEMVKIIDGLIRFREVYTGEIWLEIFVVKSINDHDGELTELYRTIKKIRPDKVQLNSLDRPPADPRVRPVEMKKLEAIKQKWKDLPVEIVKRIRRREEIVAFSKNLESTILNTITRRPLMIDDLVQLTGKNRLEIFKYIDVLEKEMKIYPKIVGKKIFYTAKT